MKLKKAGLARMRNLRFYSACLSAFIHSMMTLKISNNQLLLTCMVWRLGSRGDQRLGPSSVALPLEVFFGPVLVRCCVRSYRLSVPIVLARLLLPADFGLLGMAIFSWTVSFC